VKQDYLRIAREYMERAGEQTTAEDVTHRAPNRPTADTGAVSDATVCEISEISEISPDRQALASLAAEYVQGREQITGNLGIDTPSTSPGAWEHKSTLPGQPSPAEQIAVLQEWLTGIDWRQGLRCGLTGKQCRACKGIPCRDSTAWGARGQGE
jgi:hypothetical protein